MNVNVNVNEWLKTEGCKFTKDLESADGGDLGKVGEVGVVGVEDEAVFQGQRGDPDIVNRDGGSLLA